MSRTGTLILLGVLIMLVPFSGIPVAFRSLLSLLFGIGVLAIGLLIRAEEVRRERAALPTADMSGSHEVSEEPLPSGPSPI